MAQAELGQIGQGQDFSGNNNNPGTQKKNATTADVNNDPTKKSNVTEQN